MKVEIEWIDVCDAEPHEGSLVLVTRNGLVEISDPAIGLFFDPATSRQIYGVTHWAKLPIPAKAIAKPVVKAVQSEFQKRYGIPAGGFNVI